MPRAKRERSEYFVGLNGQGIPVSREVYHAWYSGKRQEEYQRERQQKFGVLPISCMGDGETDVLEVLPSQENVEETVERELRYEHLHQVIRTLPESERRLIHAIYFEEKNLAEIAEQEGVNERTIRRRKQSILENMKKYF